VNFLLCVCARKPSSKRESSPASPATAVPCPGRHY